MRDNFTYLKAFIQHGWKSSFIIALCLASIILIGIFVVRKSSFFKESPAYEEMVLTTECSTDDVVYSLNLIPPEQLGVTEWEIGAYAVYQYRRQYPNLASLLKMHALPNNFRAPFATRDVKFHIIGELEVLGKKRYWLRKIGLNFFRSIPVDIYRLASHTDMRIADENPRYDFPRNYVPARFNACSQTSVPIATLIKLNEGVLQTAAGQFECVQYRVEFGTGSPPIEIWANPNVLPSGIVRVSTPNEVLELTDYGQDENFDIPAQFQPVIEGITTLAQGCTSCHGYDNCHEFISPPR